MSDSWLRDYSIITERKLDRQKIEWNGPRDDQDLLGDVSPGLRSIRLYNIPENLIPVDETIQDSESRTKELRAIATDSLVAHEVGSGRHPYGHGAVLLDPRWAHPTCLFDQDVLNQGALLLATESKSAQFPQHYLSFLSQPIQSLPFDEWFYEMLALLAQRRRLQEHLSSRWNSYTTNMVKSWHDNLLNLDQDPHDSHMTSHALGTWIWKIIEQRHGSRAESILHVVMNRVFESPRLLFQSGSVAIGTSPPPQVMLAALEMDPNSSADIETQLRNVIVSAEKTGADEKFKPYNRVQGMAINQALWKKSTELLGPQFSIALHCGELWIALHNMVWVTQMIDDVVSMQLRVSRNALKLVDSETLRLAARILILRQAIVEPIRISFPSNSNIERTGNLAAYLQGKISLEEFQNREYRTQGRMAYRPVGLERFSDIPERLRQYHDSHKSEIESWMKEPAAHIEVYLSSL